MTALQNARPHVHRFLIGEQVGSSDTHVVTVERRDMPRIDTIYGMVENKGTSDFTFSANTGRRATATITLSEAARLDDADTVIVNDSVNSAVTFEFDNNATVTGGNVAVTIGGSALADAYALAGAINARNAAGVLNVRASVVNRNSDNPVIGLYNVLATSANTITITLGGTTASGTEVTFATTAATGTVKQITVAGNGTPVNNVTVRPGARVAFAIEIASGDVQDFYNFLAAPASGTKATGVLTLSHHFGSLELYNDYV